MKLKLIIGSLCSLAVVACSDNSCYDTLAIRDGSTLTSQTYPNQTALIFDHSGPVRSYKIYSADSAHQYDPTEWSLYGKRGNKWELIDSKSKQEFCARYQEILYSLPKSVEYNEYKLELKSKADSVAISEVELFEDDLVAAWDKFPYPHVDLIIEDSQSKGAELYDQLVQNKNEYVKYHTKRVCQILYFSQDDPLLDVDTIKYTLRDYEGISAKSGSVPTIGIVYSTQHCAKIGSESLHALNDETRGVLYHELTHAYQYEPKNCGTYSDGGIFWAHIEGMADAVRTEAGSFDIAALRKPGGHWMDGYKTTGFFLHWLKGKDPDAIRKFHASARDLDTWSFDGAMEYIFKEPITTQQLWDEYQAELIAEQNSKL